MTKTFRRFINRKDPALTGFLATDAAAQTELLSAICTNSATAYVRQLTAGGAVNVPNHAATAVEAHLIKMDWKRR